MRLHWQIDICSFEQTGGEIGLEFERMKSNRTTPGTGSGHGRTEDGRRSAAGVGRWIVGFEERFRGPETHRRIVSGDRNGSGPGGLDCGKAVMQRGL